MMLLEGTFVLCACATKVRKRQKSCDESQFPILFISKLIFPFCHNSKRKKKPKKNKKQKLKSLHFSFLQDPAWQSGSSHRGAEPQLKTSGRACRRHRGSPQGLEKEDGTGSPGAASEGLLERGAYRVPSPSPRGAGADHSAF